MPPEEVDSFDDFEKALEDLKHRRYELVLYVAGNTIKSAQAIASIRQICETHLKGRYELKVVDIYQQPELLRGKQIVAAPTLIKELPPPLRRLVGNLTNPERILVGLDLNMVEDSKDQG